MRAEQACGRPERHGQGVSTCRVVSPEAGLHPQAIGRVGLGSVRVACRGRPGRPDGGVAGGPADKSGQAGRRLGDRAAGCE